MVYKPDLKSGAERRVGSTPTRGTMTTVNILDEWVLKNVFSGNKHEKHNPKRISSYAKKELLAEHPEQENLDWITGVEIIQSMDRVRKEKNFNLERFPFEDPDPV